MFRLFGLLGVLITEVILTAVFFWVLNKLVPTMNKVLRLIVSNAISLAVYTVAMGYSLVPDLTRGEAPHLLEAFSIGVLPQLICLGFGLINIYTRKAVT